jgi:hypothetical protein
MLRGGIREYYRRPDTCREDVSMFEAFVLKVLI